MKILRILLSISETSGPYNQFCLPFHDSEEIHLVIFKSSGIDYSQTNLKVKDAHGNLLKFVWLVFLSMNFRSYDFIHIHHANMLPFTLFNLRNQILVFTLGTCHDNLKSRHRHFMRWFMPFVSALVCCSGAVFKSVMNSELSKHGRKIRQIDHGINLDRVPLVKPKKPDIIVASRLIRSKNIDLVIEAFNSSEYRGELHIYGAGDQMDNLKALAGSGRAHVHGLIARDQLLERLSESANFVSASGSDGLPISVLEAAASGCHLILIDSEPHLYLRDSGLDCDIFRTKAELVEKFNGLKYRQEDQVAKTAARIVHERFSAKAMCSKYQALGDELKRSGKLRLEQH